MEEHSLFTPDLYIVKVGTAFQNIQDILYEDNFPDQEKLEKIKDILHKVNHPEDEETIKTRDFNARIKATISEYEKYPFMLEQVEKLKEIEK